MASNDSLKGVREGDAYDGKITIEAVYHRSPKGWVACQGSDNHHGKFGLTGVLGDDVSEGSLVSVQGVWRKNSKYGWQVTISNCTLLKSNDKEGFVKVLKRVCRVHGAVAEIIWHHYGDSSYEACLDISKLTAIPGMNPLEAKTVVTSMSERLLKERKSIVLSEMMTLGASGAAARRAFEDFGELSYDLLTVHPFTFGIVYGGLSFDRASVLSSKTARQPTRSETRRLAARWGLMEAASESGHVYLPKAELIDSMMDRIAGMRERGAAEVVDEMIRAGVLVAEGDSIYDRNLHEAEWVVASNLVIRQTSPVRVRSLNSDVDAVISKIEREQDTKYTDEQRKAVESAVSSPVSVITGGPGTGKTTVCLGVINALENAGLGVALCSPTGRGAKRLSQMTDRTASTIHRLLKFDPSTETWGFNTLEPVESIGAILVDETSMVDIQLARAIFDAWPAGTRIILVGDYDQLPSVGPGRFLKDVIEFGDPVAVSRLTKVFRHSGRSGIAIAAASVRQGILPELNPIEEGIDEGGFAWVEQPAVEDVLRMIPGVMEGVANEFDMDPVDVQLIVPTNIGPLGTKALNTLLRDYFNPSRARKDELRGMDGEIYRSGDKVMQIRNDYNKEVFNGDVGRVLGVKNGLLVVEFEGMEDYFEASYHPREFEDLTLAYSLTVHKCIAGDSLLITETGIKPISEVCGMGIRPGELRVIDERVATSEGPQDAIQAFRGTVEPSIKIETSRGYHLEGSHRHPILVWNQDRQETEFRLLPDLKDGDFVAIQRTCSYFPSSYQKSDYYLVTTSDSPRRKNQGHYPEKVDEKVGELMGLLVGDGSYLETKNHEIALTSADESIIEKFRFFVKDLFGGEIQLNSSTASRTAKTYYYIDSTCREWLLSVGLDYLSCRKKEVPASILRSPKTVQVAFLRGLFDADGSASGNSTRVVLATSSKIVAEQVQVMLLNFGIIALKNHVESTNSYRVEMYGNEIVKFEREIGFGLQYKKTALAAMVSRSLSRKMKSNLDIVPGAEDLVVELRSVARKRLGRSRRVDWGRSDVNRLISRVCAGTQRVSSGNVAAIVDGIDGRWEWLNEEEAFLKLKQIRDTNYYFDPIVSISSGVCSMYDISVPATENFVSNGFVSHNSQGSEFDAGVFIMHESGGRMLQRNLLYTAISRFRRGVIGCGTTSAVLKAVENDREERRNTSLKSRMDLIMERMG